MEVHRFAAPDFRQELVDLVSAHNNEDGVTADVTREDPVDRSQVVLSGVACINVFNSGPEIVGDDQV